ncbi:unnamed protein product [Choristocarpus tenellus]
MCPRQDPVECLFSFICSSNNNISRIGLMLSRIKEMYGEPILSLPGGLAQAGFAAEVRIDRASEDQLRALGFGYRAKFVVETARLLSTASAGGEGWGLDLRSKDRLVVQRQLTALSGVGPKVRRLLLLYIAVIYHH